MKKIESLNNARKTVLKLEKEINAISSNLSKVKNKDHSTMKKIINNINYLLTKEAIEKNINNKELNYENEENKENEEFYKIRKSDKNNQYHNSDRNIDYLLLYNKQKNKNNIEKNINVPYFNRKSYSSSKINIDVNTNNNSNEHNLFKDYKANLIKIKNERIDDSNRIKLINYSCNNNDNKLNKTNKTNLMTYSKPKLMVDNSKLNSKNKSNNHNSTSNNSKNNNDKIRNAKYFSLNGKNRKSNNNSDEPSILNTLYYNYKDNTESNILKNDFFNEYKKKIAFSYEEPEIYDINNNHKYNKKEEYKYESKKDIFSSIKSNKKLILEKKFKKIQKKDNIINNNYNNFNHQNNLNYICNAHQKNCLDLDKENLSKITSSQKIIKSAKNNYNKS